jgi:sugar/nucleoside kinase (ribokinase family)
MSKCIWVAGDFLIDRWLIGHRGAGSRFVIDSIEKRQGGASNTLSNVDAICKNSGIEVHGLQGFTRTLSRYVVDDEVLLETWDETQERLCLCMDANGVPAINELGLAMAWKKARWNTLVVSEYNKGAANIQKHHLNNMAQRPGLVDLLVVDSRYRTVHPEILRLGKTTVWRCTDTEYEEQYAHQFTWVVHTSHGGAVRLLNNRQELLATYHPPEIKVVDTVGAGDTFTAALASYLTEAQHVDELSLRSAIQFAIKAAQNVCKKPLTAVTDVTLE